MRKNEVHVGHIYEGPPRRGVRVFREVTAIEVHPGFATMVVFNEDYLEKSTLSKSSYGLKMTLKSFAAWASKKPAA